MSCITFSLQPTLNTKQMSFTATKFWTLIICSNNLGSLSTPFSFLLFAWYWTSKFLNLKEKRKSFKLFGVFFLVSNAIGKLLYI